MKFVYLFQGAADLLRTLAPPDGAVVYALCYDRSEAIGYAQRTIYDPRCSWAEGRNKLADIALTDHPDLDYLVLADDDVEFISGSFVDFERQVRASQPKLGTPLLPKAERFGGYDPTLDEQRAVIIDEQLVALHRSLIGIDGICPLVTRYDEISWTSACLIFEYLTISKFGNDCRQYNSIRVANNGHAGVTGGTLYKAGSGRDTYAAFRRHLAEMGIPYDPSVMFFLRQNQSFAARKVEQMRRVWKRISERS